MSPRRDRCRVKRRAVLKPSIGLSLVHVFVDQQTSEAVMKMCEDCIEIMYKT